ncbi:MAG: DUF542 domain-containing protein [Nitrospina sp.]|jgi:regulator of cell morphogenesis and NO signaling|nr:DUF542 domain-containing protein [Nitrospina sp.]
MENTLYSNNNISSLVSNIPGSAMVLEELGIDYYCHGNSSLAEACAEAGCNPDEILEGMYNVTPEMTPRRERDLSKAGLDRMLDHVTEEHYGFILGVTPVLNQLMKEVVTRHGKSHPDLIDLNDLFTLLCEELGAHMLKEEKMLHKETRRFESSGQMESASKTFPKNQMQRGLEYEHLRAISHIKKIRRITNGYAAPEYACPDYRTLLWKMKKLELDLHRHICEENYIVYPKAF